MICIVKRFSLPARFALAAICASTVLSVFSVSAATPQVLFAVNTGGPAYKSVNGIQYQADNYYTCGAAAQVTSPIANTDDDIIYQSERFGTFTYRFPGLQTGTYTMKLQFSETYWKEAGKRVFSVKIEGKTVIQNLDIFSVVGGNAAYDITIDAYVQDGELTIEFPPAKCDQPKICGIVVFKTRPVPQATIQWLGEHVKLFAKDTIVPGEGDAYRCLDDKKSYVFYNGSWRLLEDNLLSGGTLASSTSHINMNGADLHGANILSGNVLEAGQGRFDGAVNAASFSGDGSRLTNIPIVIANGSITAEKLAAGAVPSGKMSAEGGTDGQVLVNTGSKVEWRNAPTGQLANGSVQYDHLSAQALDKIATFVLDRFGLKPIIRVMLEGDDAYFERVGYLSTTLSFDILVKRNGVPLWTSTYDFEPGTTRSHNGVGLKPGNCVEITPKGEYAIDPNHASVCNPLPTISVKLEGDGAAFYRDIHTDAALNYEILVKKQDGSSWTAPLSFDAGETKSHNGVVLSAGDCVELQPMNSYTINPSNASVCR